MSEEESRELIVDDVVAQLEKGDAEIVTLIGSVYLNYKPRYAFILSAFYGLGRDKWTLARIGALLNISKGRVRQIRMRAERDLWQHLVYGKIFNTIPWE